MTRYFFDVLTHAAVRYDYSGRVLAEPEQAHELAQLIALDLGCQNGDDARDREVQVRDASGGRLFSVAVPHPETVAS